MSTSTRNFRTVWASIPVFLVLPNWLPDLRPADGKIPTVGRVHEHIKVVNAKAADIYRYMNFLDQIPGSWMWQQRKRRHSG